LLWCSKQAHKPYKVIAMKNALTITLVLILWGISSQLFAQNGVKQWLDKDKKPTTNGAEVTFYRLVKYTESGKPIGTVQDYYLTDTLQFTGSLLAQNPDAYDGTCVWYHPNGAKQREAYYLNGELAGRVAVWNQDGRALYEGAYKKGKQWGRHIFWDEKGNFVSVDFYQNGQKFNITEVATALPALPDDTKATLYTLSKHLSHRFLADAADAHAFNHFGEQLLEQNLFTQALCLFMASKQIRQVLALPAGVQETDKNLAATYEAMGNTKMASAYLQKSGALSAAKPQPEKTLPKQPAKDRQEVMVAYEASIRQTANMLKEQPLNSLPFATVQKQETQPETGNPARIATSLVATLQTNQKTNLFVIANTSRVGAKPILPIVNTQAALAIQTTNLATEDYAEETTNPDAKPIAPKQPDDLPQKTLDPPHTKAKPAVIPAQPQPTPSAIAKTQLPSTTSTEVAPVQKNALPKPSPSSGLMANNPSVSPKAAPEPTASIPALPPPVAAAPVPAAKPDAAPVKPSATAAELPNAANFIAALSKYLASNNKTELIQALSVQLGVNIANLNRQDAAAIQQLINQMLNNGAYAGITAAFDASPDALKTIKDESAKATLLLGLAKAAQQQGLYAQALQHYEQVTKIATSAKNAQATWGAEAKQGLVNTFVAQKEYARATELLTELKTAAEKNGNDAALAQLNNQLGNLYFDQGAYDKAAANYKLSAEHHEYLANRSGVALATLKTANMLALQGKYAEAETQYRQAMVLAERLKLPKHLAAVYNNWGVLLYFKGNYPEAEQHFTRSAQLWEKEPEHFTAQIPVMLNTAAAAAETGNVKQAYQLYCHYLELAQQTDFLHLPDEWQMLTVKKHEMAAKEAVKLAVQLSKPDEAFALAEQSKMHQTAQYLLQPETGLTLPIDPLLQAEELYWQHSLHAISRQVAQPANAAQTKQLAQTQQMLLNGYQKFMQELPTNAPQYAALKYPTKPHVEQIQETLLPDEVMISYLLGNKQAYAFLIAKSVYQCFTLDNAATIEQEVEQLYANYLKPASELPDKDLRKAEKKLQEAFALHAGKLYNKLILPIQKSGLLSGAKKLIIVPDGILHTLPFQLLVEPGSTPVTNYKDYPYLAKQYAITTYPAAGAFYQLSKPAPQNTGKVLALANPTLQTSATQSNTYSNLVLGKATIAPPAIAVYDAKTQFTPFEAANLTLLQQNQVAETKLKQLSRQPYQYLHLAAPFVFNSQYPQFSGLIVGGTQGNNALLTLPKLAELSPSAALLNLPFAFSHTPSGLQGNAVATLQLTTLQAGIGAATYSLWLPQVSHATQFYTLLYDRLAQNTPLPDAYQHTQLQMMQTDEFAAPAAWAAFTLSGGFAGR